MPRSPRNRGYPSRGTVMHTVLVYAVSEPDTWTLDAITEDLGIGRAAVGRATLELVRQGLVHVVEPHRLTRLVPTAEGEAWVRDSVRGARKNEEAA